MESFNPEKGIGSKGEGSTQEVHAEGMYQCKQLDPRPTDPAREANEAIFASGPVWGVEVTVPALAAQCEVNLDPQHMGQDASTAAIEAAVEAELPPAGATLVTVRPDLDALGAMAVFAIRGRGDDLAPAMERIQAIAKADKFSHGDWPGPRPFPSHDSPWDEGESVLAAIGKAVVNHSIPLNDRVTMVETWLLEGTEPDGYRDQVEDERDDMITALEDGRINTDVASDGRIAVVNSTHSAATAIGYRLAPVVVAVNPEYQTRGSEPHRKVTICTYKAQYADIGSALAELKELEDGWGGSPIIGGSPQGVSSTLTTEQVVEVVEKYLKSNDESERTG